jgi:hypothetical protein
MTTTVFIPEKSESLKEKAKKWWKKAPKPDPIDTTFFLITAYDGFNQGFLQPIVTYTWFDFWKHVIIDTSISGVLIGTVIFVSSQFFGKNFKFNIAFLLILEIAFLLPYFAGMLVRHHIDPLHISAEVIPYVLIYIALELLEKFKPKP